MSDADTRLELPPSSKDHLAREAEARRILDVYGDDLPGIMAMLERQFAVLHNRAQVALVLCGVVISTTGFSGRLVAGTNALSQWLIIIGLSLIILAAGVVVRGVLHLRWLTMQGGQDTAQWLVTSLAYRDKKTAHYRVGVIILLVGLILYGGALAVTLLNPEEDQLPPRSRVQASSSVIPSAAEGPRLNRAQTHERGPSTRCARSG